jgi:CRP/FNR family transcriptional regulator
MVASDQQADPLVELFQSGTRLTYRKGEYVMRPGDAPKGVFYIQEGLVKAFNITKYGEENLLIIRKEHEIFPLIWAVTGQERHIVYQTLSPTLLWRIDEDLFRDFLRRHTRALNTVLEMVTEMYRIHSERILNLEYRSVRERLVSFLLTMSLRFGKVTPRGVVLEVPLRHQDIASSINASRETASRELAYLERHGLISNHRSNIVLHDINALEAFL